MFPTMRLTNGLFTFFPTNIKPTAFWTELQGQAVLEYEDAFLPRSLVQFGRVKLSLSENQGPGRLG